MREEMRARFSWAPGLLLLALWLGPASAAWPAGLLRFRSPTIDSPFFRIEFPFVVEGDKVSLKNLELNGVRSGPFLAFKDGRNVPLTASLGAGTYMIVLDYAWAGGKPYRLRLNYEPDTAAMPKTLEIAGVSPKEGGIPGGKEGFYRAYLVEEEAGLERRQEIVSLTLVGPKADIDPSRLVFFDGAKAVPFEIIEERESVPPGPVSAAHPLTSTLKIILPIDAEAHEKKLLLALQGERAPAPAKGLTISGEGLGKTIRGSRLTLELDPQSGQVRTIDSVEARIKLFNKAGVIHWNPDVFVPGIAWDHSFDWNPPATVEEKAGAYLYLNSRRGPLPRVKGVMLSVKYTLAAGAPYFLSETRLDFEEGQGVIAVRNDEMVLSRDLFDSLLYRDKKGELVKLPLREKEGTPFGLVHTAPEDLGWVGLVNSRGGFGFFSLRILAVHGNLEHPGELLHKAGTYFYAPSDGDYVYWVRPLIYTWADFFTNNHLAFVPKGSFFYEKNAYIVIKLGADFPQRLDGLLKELRHALKVF
jgi:hypothetical protein